jgi:hypothetical protein
VDSPTKKYALRYFVYECVRFDSGGGLGPNVQEFFEAIDVFMAASPEDNRVQLEDALRCVQDFRLSSLYGSSEKLKTTVLERLLLRAVQLRLPVRSFSPVIANENFRSSISPSVLTAYENYMKSVTAPVRVSPLLLADSDSKRPRLDGESDDVGRATKRPKNGRKPSDPIVID